MTKSEIGEERRAEELPTFRCRVMRGQSTLTEDAVETAKRRTSIVNDFQSWTTKPSLNPTIFN